MAFLRLRVGTKGHSHHVLVGSVDGNAEEVANRSAYLFDARELAAARKVRSL